MNIFKKVALAVALSTASVAGLKIAQATISNISTKTISAVGNGSTTNYTIGFSFQANSQIKVYLQNNSVTPRTRSLLTYGSGAGKYTITGGDPGTTVVMGTAPTSSQQVVIIRSTPLTQIVDYNETDAFPAADHEQQMDKMVQAIQEISSSLSSSLALSPGTTASSTPTLPDPSANKFLVYNSAGSDLTLSPTSTPSSGDVLKFDGSAWSPYALDSNISSINSTLSSHIANTSNPHSVTAAQVGNTTAQWNANKISGITVSNSAIGDGKALVYNSGSGQLEYVQAANPNTVAPNFVLAGPTTAPSSAPSFRPLVYSDLPALSASKAVESNSFGVIVSSSYGTATNANTVSTLVARDSNGDFSAGNIGATRLRAVNTSEGSQPCPSMTQTQRDALLIYADGDCIYNSTAKRYERYDSGAVAWLGITSINNADVASGAAIAYSKLSLSNSITNSDINSSAAISDTKLATISTASKVSNSATTATSANTASAIVARDGSGNFSAGTITASSVSNGSNSITGTSGAGFLEIPTQSSNPSAPASGARLFADSSGRYSWRRSTGQVVTYDASGLSANRVYTLPDASTTLTGTDNTATLTNKTISGSSNTLSNIARSSVSAGTASHVVINDGSGNLSSEAQLATSRGGTGQNLSAASGAISVSAGTVSAGTLSIGNGGSGQTSANAALNAFLPTQASSAGKFLKTDGSNTTWDFAGGGAYQSGTNLVTNNSFESDVTGWTGSTNAPVRVTSSGNFIPPGVAAASWATTSTQTLTSASTTITASGGLAGRNAVISCAFKAGTGGLTHTLGVWDGSTLASTVNVTPVTTGWTRFTTNFIFPASGTQAIRITGGGTETLYVDDCFMGLAENFNISNVSQASMYGALRYPGTALCTWNSSSGTVANYAADTDCSAPTASGNASAPGTKIPGITFSALPPGEYAVSIQGLLTTGASTTCQYNISDGTGTGGYAEIYNGTSMPGTLWARFSYTTAQSSLTFQVQVKRSSGASTCDIYNADTARNFDIQVYRYPLNTEQAVRANQQTLPTVQKFTSGSGTYTTPTGVSYIRVRMCGGGGGGGAATTNSGTAGNASTFGSSLLTANGGGAGTFGPAGAGGAGGTATLTAPAIGTAQNGNSGQAGNQTSTAGTNYSSALGGSSPFGGVTSAANNVAGSNAAANSCSGGGGGTQNATGGGGGGGSGGYIDAIISAPSASYAYAVGASANGGTAGVFAGGSGGSGYIEVTEFYGAQNAPILVGSITSNSLGAERIERARIDNSAGGGTITSQSGSWVTRNTSTTGDVTLDIPAGLFSAAPACSCIAENVNVNLACVAASTPTTTQIRFRTYNTSNTLTNAAIAIICAGPR